MLQVKQCSLASDAFNTVFIVKPVKRFQMDPAYRPSKHTNKKEHW